MSYTMQPISAQGYTPYDQLEHLKAEVQRKIDSIQAEVKASMNGPLGNGRRQKPYHHEVVALARREALLDVLAVLDGKPGVY